MDKSQEHTDIVKRIIDREIWCNQTMLVVAMIGNGHYGGNPSIDDEDIINYRFAIDKEAKDEGYDSLADMEETRGLEKEVFEWWLVTDWLGDKIEQLGGVVIKSGYGTWWGREETGQSLTMDSTINAVAANLIKE